MAPVLGLAREHVQLPLSLMTEEKSAGYVRLVESCAEPGCPICRCVVRESRGHLDAILY